MGWMHNPVGDMYGPHFLGFYAVVIVLVFIITKLIFHFFDPSDPSNVPQVPLVVDPYEIAYLRGGENEVTRLAIFDLIQRGYLERITKAKGGDQIAQAKDRPDERHLGPVEKAVFFFFVSPCSAQDVFQSDLGSQVRKYCDNYQMKLEQERFILRKPDSGFFNMVMIIGLAVIVGLGGYKLIVALAKGRYNVEFLILMGVGAGFLHLGLFRPPRMSLKGRKYLERLQLAYDRLENKEAKKNFHTTDPTLLLMAGVFGVGALAGTGYSYYPAIFQKANNRWYSSSSCGAGCGYTVSSCGGGGGGGCGGGGCGGCGG